LMAERKAGETIELLESLYLESHSGEELAALRAPHLAADEETARAESDLDKAAYRRDLRAALVASLPVDNDELRALGTARAEAVSSYLVGTAAVDSGRIQVTEPVAAATGGGQRMRCRLDIRTGG